MNEYTKDINEQTYYGFERLFEETTINAYRDILNIQNRAFEKGEK